MIINPWLKPPPTSTSLRTPQAPTRLKPLRPRAAANPSPLPAPALAAGRKLLPACASCPALGTGRSTAARWTTTSRTRCTKIGRASCRERVKVTDDEARLIDELYRDHE